MEQEIRENRFLEHGDHGGNLYGTHLDSIRDVIKQGIRRIKKLILCSTVHNKSLH